MSLINKLQISGKLIAILSCVLVSATSVFAQSSSTLSGKYYQDGHLALTNTFDTTPSGARCRIDLYAKISNIPNGTENDGTATTTKIIARNRSGSKRLRYTTSTLPRLKKSGPGTSDDAYPQLNLQTKSRCNGQTIVSNTLAIALKCGDTTARTGTAGRFFELLDNSLGGD